MSTPITWQKSSRSQNSGDCVELSRDRKFIRDSKNPSGPILAADATVLVRAVRAGSFDR